MKETWELAYEDYVSGMKYKEIAQKYDVTLNTVKSWKTRHWNKLSSKKGVHTKKDKSVHTKRKRGGQPGNKNATGPPGNKHAEKHGFFSKWLPEETQQIIGEMPTNELETLWMNIQLQFAAIIRSQKIMHVIDQHDKTVEKIEYKDGNVTGERWEVQQAWDKQATFLSAQSRAMKTLESMIKNYTEMLHQNWDIASKEQKARLELLQAQKKKLEQVDDSDEKEKQEKMDTISDLINQMNEPSEEDYYEVSSFSKI